MPSATQSEASGKAEGGAASALGPEETRVDALRGGAANLLQHGAGLLLGLLVTTLAGRELEPQDFGFFALTATLVSLLQFALDHGTGTLVLRDLGRNPLRAGPLLSRIWAHRRRVATGCALLFAGLALAFEAPGRRVALLFLALTAPFYGPLGLVPLLVVRGLLTRFAAFATLNRMGFTLLFVVLAVLEAPAFTWALVLLAREVAAARIPVFLLRGRDAVSIRPRASRGMFAYSKSALWLGGAGLLQQLYFQGDLLIVGLVAGDVVLGTYAAAARLVNPVFVAAALLLGPFLPALSDPNEERRRIATHRVFRVGAFAGALFALLAHTPWILGLDAASWLLVYQQSYVQGETDATAAFRLLIQAPLAIGLGAAALTTLAARGAHRAIFGLSLLGLVTNLSANLILVEGFGPSGAAFATLLTECAVASGAIFRCARLGVFAGFHPLAFWTPLWLVVLAAVFNRFVPPTALGLVSPKPFAALSLLLVGSATLGLFVAAEGRARKASARR